MERLKRLMAVLLAVTLAACSAPAPAPESAAPPPPAETPAPESESPASAIPAALPDSIRIQQRGGDGEVYWDLLVTEPEDIRLVAGLLATEGLALMEDGAERWSRKKNPVVLELNYPDTTIEAGTHRAPGEMDGILRVGEVFYSHPSEKSDRLFEYLSSWEIAFMAE